VVLRPGVQDPDRRAGRCAETFEKHCTVTSSVKQGIEVRVRVDWNNTRQSEDAENHSARPPVSK
jgi:hypothetical protein